MTRTFGQWILLLLVGLAPAYATTVTPPEIDWVSIPSTATVGVTVNVGAGAHGNLSDDDAFNDGGENLMRIIIELKRAGSSTWTTLCDWLPTVETPASAWTSFVPTDPGTHYIRVQIMDSRPWYSTQEVYSISAATAAPTITSSLTASANERQSVSYTITATSSPTSYGASGLPTGLSVNTSTGAITGTVTQTGTVNSTITATNAHGTDSKTLVWTITAASITANGSISPTSVVLGNSVTLTRAATTNFGLGWTENVIWRPVSGPQTLGNLGLGTMSYTAADGPGTYTYQFRVVDIYSNYVDQWLTLTVTEPVTPPTTVTVTGTGSYSVSLSWSGATATAGINHYNIYRDGTLIGNTTGTTYTDTTAAPGTTYSYKIKTVDNNSVLSSFSSATGATTATSFDFFTPLL
jgi:hypothetical protein